MNSPVQTPQSKLFLPHLEPRQIVDLAFIYSGCSSADKDPLTNFVLSLRGPSSSEVNLTRAASIFFLKRLLNSDDPEKRVRSLTAFETYFVKGLSLRRISHLLRVFKYELKPNEMPAPLLKERYQPEKIKGLIATIEQRANKKYSPLYGMIVDRVENILSRGMGFSDPEKVAHLERMLFNLFEDTIEELPPAFVARQLGALVDSKFLRHSSPQDLGETGFSRVELNFEYQKKIRDLTKGYKKTGKINNLDLQELISLRLGSHVESPFLRQIQKIAPEFVQHVYFEGRTVYANCYALCMKQVDPLPPLFFEPEDSSVYVLKPDPQELEAMSDGSIQEKIDFIVREIIKICGRVNHQRLSRILLPANG